MEYQTNKERADKIIEAVGILTPLAETLADDDSQTISPLDLKDLKQAQDLLERARLKPVFKKCPICQKFYNPQREALSRKDNTPICSDCGTAEAMADLR